MSGMTVLANRPRILIVDDDPACRALLDAIFDLHGFQVTKTDSVLGASELIAQVRPTIILLDLALPYRSGASWLAQLKANPETAHIPVVILSAVSETLPRERRELAQAVVRKPFRTRTLVETVQAVCAGETLVEADITFDPTSSPPLGSL
jgi:two-component system phosphate regulon response regulator PhoB